MNFQYISDNMGHTTAVQLQIPISEWEQMKKKYKELREEEEKANAATIPDWHKELVLKEKELVAAGKTELMDWNEAKKSLKL